MYKVELTSDGKVSIPLEIREHLELHTGESLVFFTSTDTTTKKVEIIKEHNVTECPVCLGEGTLIKKFYPCFACEQKRFILSYRSVKEFIFRLSYLKYKINMNMIERVISLDHVGHISIPILTLRSSYYPKKIILEGQIKLQKLLIEEATSKITSIKEHDLIELNEILEKKLNLQR